jgi:hypothetical protein
VVESTAIMKYILVLGYIHAPILALDVLVRVHDPILKEEKKKKTDVSNI